MRTNVYLQIVPVQFLTFFSRESASVVAISSIICLFKKNKNIANNVDRRPLLSTLFAIFSYLFSLILRTHDSLELYINFILNTKQFTCSSTYTL